MRWFVFLLAVVSAFLWANPQTLAAPSGPTPTPSTGFNVSFTLSGSNIPTQDGYSEADSFVKLFSGKRKASGEENEEELERFGTTSHITNDPNPVWPETFWFWYQPNVRQYLKFYVRDHDVMDVDDDIGHATANTDDIINARGPFRVDLNNGGALTIHRTQPMVFKVKARNLPRKDSYWGSEGPSDPYAIISYRRTRNAEPLHLATTSTISDEDNPVWPEMIELSQFQPGTGQYLDVSLYDEDTFSGDDFLGKALISCDDISKRRGPSQAFLAESNGRASFVIEMV